MADGVIVSRVRGRIGPGPGRRRSGYPSRSVSRAVVSVALLALLCSVAVQAVDPGRARAEDRDAVLEGSGIRYPGGYDPNTVGEIRGKAYGLSLPEKGPVRFRLETGKESYTVLAAPAWYWKDLNADLPDGTEVRVRGSKALGNDMNLYVVAQGINIVASGRSVVLRDHGGTPFWTAGSMGPAGAPGGARSPMHGGGWMGGGHGGMGGRHR